MKSDGRSNILSSVVSEWEDNVLFDADDPDFAKTGTNAPAANLNVLNAYMLKVPSNMSLADIQNPHLAELCNSMGRNSIRSMSSSLSDLVGSPLEISVDNVITIEDLRAQMGSCFTCGVSWTDDHVSLDCSECGGYSSERPCPLCDGNCGMVWKRDFNMSHTSGKARWLGVCPTLSDTIHNHLPALLSQATPQTCAASQVMPQELCARLEQLSARAQT
ncbi:protein pinocchio isoform X1 [Bradysia coprophila]|uniref:protein pinocchio isoform X1 n=1 Tax=Bradysia coprophila TaxID=38358 RepID=UPI00187D75A7|nr:protein pinocchio isoform X1 [Bradysia coprophila]